MGVLRRCSRGLAAYCSSLRSSGSLSRRRQQRAEAGTSPALIGYDDGTSGGVFELSVGSSSQPTDVAPAGAYPQFSPNGTELAYDLGRTTTASVTNSIVVADRDGAAPRDLITGPTKFDGTKNSVLYPLVWSADGKEIAYGCDGGRDAEGQLVLYVWEQICVVNVTTGAHHMITDPATDTEPAAAVGLDERWSWTPDGKDILATVDEPGPCLNSYSFDFGCGTAAIGRINVDTGATTLLTHSSLTTSTQASTSVSPDGDHILFYDSFYAGSGTSGLYLANANGGDAHLLNVGGLNAGAGAIFTPNGKEIVFTAYPSSSSYYVQAFEVPPAGSNHAVQVTDANTNVYNLTETPPLTTCTVLKLTGKTVAKARSLLKKAACTLGKIHGPKSHRSRRHIVKQSRKPNRDEPAGTKVNITLGKKVYKKH